MFDDNGDGLVSHDELEAKVLEIFQQREFMARTLTDTDQIITKVGRLIFILLIVASVQMTAVIWGEEVQNLWQVGWVGWWGGGERWRGKERGRGNACSCEVVDKQQQRECGRSCW